MEPGGAAIMSSLPAQGRADSAELSMFSRPHGLFLRGSTLSSVQKLCDFSEY